MKISFKYISQILLFGLIYYLTLMMSLWFEVIQGISPFWPAAGLAAALLFLGGYRYWLAILLGTTAVSLSLSSPFPIFVTNSAAHIGEAVILVYLLRRFHHFSGSLKQINELVKLIIVIIPAVLFTGLMGLVGFIITSTPIGINVTISLLALMVGNAVGIIVVMPLILVWKRPFSIPLTTQTKTELFISTLIGIAILFLTITIMNSSTFWYIPLFLSLPIMVWATLRFQLHGATAAALFIAVLIAIVDLQTNKTSLNYPEIDGFILQTSIIVITTLAGLLIAIVLVERDAGQVELLKSQAKLQEQLDFSQTIMDTLGQGIFVVNLDGQFEYVNPAYAKAIGYTIDEILEQSPTDFIPDAYHHKYEEAIIQRKQGVTSSYESELRHKNDTIISVLVTGAPRLKNGRVTGSIVISTDLTERNRAQEMIQLIVSKSPNTTLIINQKTEIIFANALVKQMFGYSPDELIGTSFHKLIPDRFRHTHPEQEAAYHHNPITKGLGAGRVLRAQRIDGAEISVEISISPIEMAGEAMVLATIVDISPRMIMEQKLKQREAHLRILVEQAPIGIITANMEGIVTDANPYSVKLLGSPSKEKTIGLNLLTLPPLVKAGLSDAFQTTIRSGETIEKETWYTSIWNKNVYFLMRIVPHRNENDEQIGLLILIEDMTARIQAEEAMLHLQKTESLGILAGGIAHDFNNLLVAIMAQSSLALLKMDDDAPARTNVEKSNSAAKRAADLTNQLLAYSGRGRFHISHLNINDLIEENRELFTATLPKHVNLIQNLTPDLPLIEADVPQIQQIVMNLIINAAEAMGEKGGTVHLATDIKIVKENDSQYGQYVTGLLDIGIYVRLEVRDTGTGMDAETIKKIFDPFFSTKETGHGLGLAAVLGIVSGHHGALSVSSNENGTIFNLLFPALDDDAITRQSAVKQKPVVKNGDPLAGMVLIIDDENTVCMAVTDILGLEKIETLSAYNGRDGVALYQEKQDTIALVILDLSMPGWSGQRTLRELRAINPTVCIILSSGYSKEDTVQRFDEEIPSAFLSKPYNADELIDVVKQNWPSSSIQTETTDEPD